MKDNNSVNQEWISVKERLPEDFNSEGMTQNYLVFIDNPFFQNGNYHVAYFQKVFWGEQYNHWSGIEPNVSHGHDRPNVTHWMRLPTEPNP